MRRTGYRQTDRRPTDPPVAFPNVGWGASPVLAVTLTWGSTYPVYAPAKNNNTPSSSRYIWLQIFVLPFLPSECSTGDSVGLASVGRSIRFSYRKVSILGLFETGISLRSDKTASVYDLVIHFLNSHFPSRFARSRSFLNWFIPGSLPRIHFSFQWCARDDELKYAQFINSTVEKGSRDETSRVHFCRAISYWSVVG